MAVARRGVAGVRWRAAQELTISAPAAWRADGRVQRVPAGRGPSAGGVTVLELSTVIGAAPKPLQLVLDWNGTAARAVPLTAGVTLRVRRSATTLRGVAGRQVRASAAGPRPCSSSLVCRRPGLGGLGARAAPSGLRRGLGGDGFRGGGAELVEFGAVGVSLPLGALSPGAQVRAQLTRGCAATGTSRNSPRAGRVR